jgi:hypothetical protein
VSALFVQVDLNALLNLIVSLEAEEKMKVEIIFLELGLLIVSHLLFVFEPGRVILLLLLSVCE